MSRAIDRSQHLTGTFLSLTAVGLCCLVVTAGAASGCGSSASTEAATRKDVQSEYDKNGRLTRLTYDRNGDGKIDTWGFMDGSRVVRVEVDEDGDGKVDRWEYHKPVTGAQGAGGAQGAQGATEGDPTLDRIDRATKHDGKISRHEYFENGVLTRVEEDTDGDGKIDKWETYSNGTLSVMALDTKGRGTPDRRLVYLPDGSLSRIEADPTGNGSWRPLPQ